MAGQPKADSNRLPEGIVDIRVYTSKETKQKIIDAAKERGVSVTDYCKPVIVALANGEIVSRVIDLREKK